jgi:ubiquinone/menaquinone biosynthesis C-methylase UbiE
MPVHDVAARGFGDGAELYERSRPSYPDEAVAHMVDRLRIRSGARVCDLGAGTGKFTRLVVGTGAVVVAVEPIPGMQTVLRRQLPMVPVVGGVAEALPLRDSSLDAVVVAQAFHWFDAPIALAEVARVLRPGGSLGLVWNEWDLAVPWLGRIHRIVADASSTPEWRRAIRSHDWMLEVIVGAGRFEDVERATFRNSQTLTPDGVVERVASTSHIRAAPEGERAHTLDAVRAVLADDPATRNASELEYAYVVDVLTCRRP